MLMRSLLSGWTRMPASPPHCLISVSPSHSPPCSSCCLGRPKGSCPEHIQPRSGPRTCWETHRCAATSSPAPQVPAALAAPNSDLCLSSSVGWLYLAWTPALWSVVGALAPGRGPGECGAHLTGFPSPRDCSLVLPENNCLVYLIQFYGCLEWEG